MALAGLVSLKLSGLMLEQPRHRVCTCVRVCTLGVLCCEVRYTRRIAGSAMASEAGTRKR